MKIIIGVTDNEMWALEFIDSWGKIPSGILWMNLVSLGNYDECLNITKQIAMDDNRETSLIDNVTIIQGQYCLANIPIPFKKFSDEKIDQYHSILKSNKNNDHRLRMINVLQPGKPNAVLGICIPRTCNATSLQYIIEKFSNISLNYTILSHKSCTNNDPIVFETIDWIAIGVFSILGLILITSTIYDYIMDIKKKNKNQLLIAFSLITNGKKLFNMKTRSSVDVINCLDGIRCLSIVWVVIGHTFIMTAFIPNINSKYILIEWTQTVYSMLLQNASVSVDSFFLLSGLLVAWIVLKELDKNNGKLNIFVMYIHRYIRLTPLLIFVILYIVSLFRYMGNGPFWDNSMAFALPLCEKNWWTTLLYVQNYVQTDQMCLGHTWYLAVDTQLYILSPLILIPLWKWGMKFGWILFVFMTGSIAFVFTTFMNNNYVLLMKDDMFNNGRQSKIYYPTHARFSPWLIGILLGYILHLNRNKRVIIPKMLIILGWIISLTTILSIIFGPFYLVKSNSKGTTLEGAFYESFSRISWSIALSWIIFACRNGYGGIINEFLSLKFWQPFSRLTYSIYITHAVVEIIISGSEKTNSHFSNFEMINRFYSDFGITLVISTITVLAFESPIVGLEKLIFKRQNTKSNISNNGIQQPQQRQQHQKQEQQHKIFNRNYAVSQEQLCNNNSIDDLSGNGKFCYTLNVA